MTFRRATDEELIDFVEGTLGGETLERVSAEIDASPDLQRRINDLRRIIGALGESDPSLQSVDLCEKLEDLISQPRGRAPARWRWKLWPLMACGAMACIVTFVFLRFNSVAPPNRLETPPAFRAKGTKLQSDDRWIDLQVFQLDHHHRPTRVKSTISAVRSLLFAYTNLGPQPYSYLMIFAVDASGELRWFHPAYEHSGSSPTAISIRKGVSGEELRESVLHHFRGQRVTIYGVFLRHPMRVLEMERLLATQRETGTFDLTQRLPLKNAAQHRLTVEITH